MKKLLLFITLIPVLGFSQTVELKCNPNNYMADIIISEDGKETVIYPGMDDCEKITKENYKNYQIPTEALSACSGHEGEGITFFYAIIKEGKLNVFYGMLAQGNKGIIWEKTPLFSK